MKEEELDILSMELPGGNKDMVIRLCIECGTDFEICKRVSAKKSPRCSICRDKRNYGRYKERLAIKQAERLLRDDKSKRVHTGGGEWKLILDPDKSWGINTRLGIEEIRLLMMKRYRYLASGTKFRNVHSGEILEIQY
jgi:hypothetical protein